MPGSLSQARTRYPPAACTDLVNEFISWVVAAARPAASAVGEEQSELAPEEPGPAWTVAACM